MAQASVVRAPVAERAHRYDDTTSLAHDCSNPPKRSCTIKLRTLLDPASRGTSPLLDANMKPHGCGSPLPRLAARAGPIRAAVPSNAHFLQRSSRGGVHRCLRTAPPLGYRLSDG